MTKNNMTLDAAAGAETGSQACPEALSRQERRRLQLLIAQRARRERMSADERARRSQEERRRYHRKKAAKQLLALTGLLPRDSGGQERALVSRVPATVAHRAVDDASSKSHRHRRAAAVREIVKEDGPSPPRPRLSVAPSRFQGGGRGVFVRCSACSRHPTRRFFSTSNEDRRAECASYVDDPSLADTIRSKILCRNALQPGRLVFARGETIGHYFGQRVGFRSTGPYVLAVNQRDGALNARHWGAILKWANGMQDRSRCNATFQGRMRRAGSRYFVEVVATRNIYEHEEIVLFYGDEYRCGINCLDWVDSIEPLGR